MKSPRISTLLATLLIIGCLKSRADILDSWTTNLLSTTAAMDCVVYGNGRYVAYGEVSDYGYLYSSEDGFNWTPRTSEAIPTQLSFPKSLAYCGGKFFALGGFGNSAVSTNGTNWTVFSLPATYEVASGAASYVAVGDSGVYVSTNGTNWNTYPVPPNSTRLLGIAYGNGLFVAIDASHSYTSFDGQDWTPFNLPGGSSISFANGIFIVPSQKGTNLISGSGTTWNPVYTGLTNQLGKVIFANHLFMARSGQYLATSVDGTNWVQNPHSLPGQSILPDPRFATDGARLVVVAGDPPTPGFGIHNGYTYTSGLLVDLEITNAPVPTLQISGLVGRSNRIEFRDSLPLTGSTNWQSLTNLPLPTSPWTLVDPTATNSAQRFYRVRLSP